MKVPACCLPNQRTGFVAGYRFHGAVWAGRLERLGHHRGLISATQLTLIVLPMLHVVFANRGEAEKANGEKP